MSLKAKLEAVIYAAEEPVTLAQLAELFTDEALAWKAEQEAAAAARVTEARTAATSGDAAESLNEAFPELGLQAVAGGEASEKTTKASAEEAASEANTTEPQAGEAGPATACDPKASAGADGETIAGTDAADASTEAKRAAKQRDREARGAIKQLLDDLITEYAADGRGIEIREIAGGYRMATKPECHDAVLSFVKSQKSPLKLSLPALETLAVIAYKQPVTAPEVNEIRGVDSSAVFGSLLARKLIATAGRKPVIGRPILYKTTREFLLRFGLKDVSELPSMEEFEKMAASELEETEAAPNEETAPPVEEFNADLSLEMEEADAGTNEMYASPEATNTASAESESAKGVE